MKYLLALGFIATVYAANWAIAHWGIVDVGFGLQAPAAVFFAGLAFTLRDATREAGGRLLCVVAVAIGALLSYLLEDVGRIALASAIAFGVSELADLAAYEPLRQRSRVAAVAISNTVGSVIDSALFLWIAFGSLAFFPGQLLGKTWVTLVCVGILAGAQYALSLRASNNRLSRTT